MIFQCELSIKSWKDMKKREVYKNMEDIKSMRVQI